MNKDSQKKAEVMIGEERIWSWNEPFEEGGAKVVWKQSEFVLCALFCFSG